MQVIDYGTARTQSGLTVFDTGVTRGRGPRVTPVVFGRDDDEGGTMTERFCPMLADKRMYESKCRKERCGWWDGTEEKCAVLLLAQQAQLAAAVLDAAVADDGGMCIHVVDDAETRRHGDAETSQEEVSKRQIPMWDGHMIQYSWDETAAGNADDLTGRPQVE